MTTLLSHALAYLQRGRSVLPLCRPASGRGCLHHGADCPKPGKRPLLAWTEYQERLPTEAEVRQWWHGWPDANLGLITGQVSGLVVVDVDGESGLAALREGGELPPTLTALTGRPGGRHLYFRHPGHGVPSRVGVVPGVDVRADGGLVALPPSLHPSGASYQWEAATTGHGLPELPSWLLTLVLVTQASQNGHEALGVAAVLQGVPEGQRDDTLFRLAARLRGADVPQEWAERLVLEAASRCRPAFPEREALAKVAGAYGRYQPRPIVAAEPSQQQASPSPSLKQNDGDDARDGERAWLITLGDLRKRYSGQVRWLVPGYIALGELTIIPAPPESLKSWAMADLCRAVSTGETWLGHFQVPRGKAMYVEQERASNLVYQAGLLESGHECDLSDVLVVPPCGVDITDTVWQARLSALVREHSPALVVINSFRSVYRGRPGDGVDMARGLGWLGRLAEEVATAIVVVDQVNKMGGLGAVRGMAAHADSLQKEFEADCVLHIERDRDQVGRGVGPARVYVGKRRAGEAGQPFSFEVVDQDGGGVRLVYLGDTTVERASERTPSATDRTLAKLVETGQEHSPEELEKLTGLALGTVKNNLTRLKATGKAERTAYGKWRVSSQASSPSLTLSDCDGDGGQVGPPEYVDDTERPDQAASPRPRDGHDAGHDDAPSPSDLQRWEALAEAEDPLPF